MPRLWTLTTLALLAGAVVFLYANGRSAANANAELTLENMGLREKLENKQKVIHYLHEIVSGDWPVPPKYYDKVLKQRQKERGKPPQPKAEEEIRQMTFEEHQQYQGK
jgi:hypothetical protein